jgi:hypothetical protein
MFNIKNLISESELGCVKAIYCVCSNEKLKEYCNLTCLQAFAINLLNREYDKIEEIDI